MVQALLVAIFSVVVTHFSPISWWFFGEPFIQGLVVGLIYGKPIEGLIIGSAINVAFLGWISAGGANASDKYFAGIFGTVLALQTDMTTAAAVAFAVPIGAIGNFAWIGWMSINSFAPSLMDKYAEKGNYKAIIRLQALFGPLVLCVLRGIPAFLVAYFGGSVIEPILASIPAWAMTGFSVVGKVLPALGMAMLLKYMGRKDLLMFFGLGFILSAYMGNTDLVFFALLGGAIALIYLSMINGRNKSVEVR